MRIRNLLLGILIAGSAVVAGCAAKDKEKEKGTLVRASGCVRSHRAYLRKR